MLTVRRNGRWGRYYYAADNIAFPFKARCVLKRSTSPLKAGDVVEVTGMAAEDDCMQELMVLIKWDDEDLAVPLIQLESPGSTGLTRQVLADWKYLGGQRLHVLSEERRLIL